MNDELTVFISYRRADSSADAGRLYDALRRRFGRENLFMDVDSLRPGEDWVDAVEAAVGRCDVLLAIIGPTWAVAKDSEGEFRLHKELDRVRLEIEAGLRNEKPVIPVLVEGASMPTSDQLPESLKPLLRRHAVRIAHSTFESDLASLVRALKIIDKARHPKPAATAAAAATMAAAASAEAAEPAPEPLQPEPATSAPVPPPPAPPAPDIAALPVTQAYSAEPPAPPVPTGYSAPPVQAAYNYQPPAYAIAQPAPRKGASPLLLGLLGIGLVAVIGVVLMAALHIGPFAVTSVSSPTPTLAQATSTPAQPTPTPQPTPTQTGEPTPTATPEPSATPSPSLEPSAPTTSPDRTPYPSAAFDPLWAIVPPDMAPSCQASSNYATPQLFCYISASSLSFWYGSYPDVDALNAAYDSWLRFYNVARETANCFDDPLPLPCEGPYQVGGYDPAGRVTVIDESGNSWIFWTHEPALVLGTGLASNTSGMAPEDLFAYWRDNAVVLNYPSPSP